jgi:hypothetical protein
VKDLPIHLVLFVLVSSVIVLMGSFYSEAEDGKALRSFPRRLAVFLFGCAVLVGIMLICEHTFAAL